ncbi:uncharacterized protein LOC142533311 [Primulina tabacum]|uniref:uncharacterized protein LOC142533311 n=1 Tax=Primulina tabacum TaxID=48773 RepID=UPI003F598B26
MSGPAADEDEVEQLLRAAQDDVLLKLSLDSHTTRAAAYSINPDLDRRYEALKAQLNPKSASIPATAAAASESRIDGPEDSDDLFARFAALKKSIPSHNNDEKQSTSKEESDGDGDGDGDDDEVEKVIKWAVDAARLDPSGTTSDDETDDEVEFDKKKDYNPCDYLNMVAR